MSEYPKVGDPISEDPPSVFELVVEDHIKFVNPKDYKLKNVESIDPSDYYITSGDAVEKARFLEKAFWSLAAALRKKSCKIIEKEHRCTLAESQAKHRSGIKPSRPKNFSDYESAVWKAAGQSRKMLNALIKTKGDNCFLETEWNNHKLLCITKNPRK